MRYRNADENFLFESDIEQFNFDIQKSSHLKIEIKWNNKNEISSLERINIYLKDHTLYKISSLLMVIIFIIMKKFGIITMMILELKYQSQEKIY